MTKRGKQYRKLAEQFDLSKPYNLQEAIEIAKKVSFAKFDASIDLAVNLGVDPKKADQNLRGAIPLPHGLGKAARVVVFAKGEKVAEAEGAGADFVGSDEIAEKITSGWLDFEHVVATPDMMGLVGRLGRVLGPRGLMPNPKMGTVTFDVGKAIAELKAGRAQYRVDKCGVVHSPFGKVSFPDDKLFDNAKVLLDALIRAKPATAKGTYLKKMTLSSTMGLGVQVDLTEFR